MLYENMEDVPEGYYRINSSAMRTVLYDHKISPRAKILILYLAQYTEPTALTQTVLNKIIKGNKSGDTVRKSLREAEEAGWISVDRTTKPHVFTVNPLLIT